jgi:hypothetical protein
MPDTELAQATKRTMRNKLASRLRYRNTAKTSRTAAVVGARDWEDAIMALTGSDWGGNWSPPFAQTLTYPWQGEERIFANNVNDGMELWFGYPHKWGWHISNREMRLLTRYLIWDIWIKARWFGLRRPIYYWALRSKVSGYRKCGPPV